MNKVVLFIAALFSVSLITCSNNDDNKSNNGNPGNTNLGEINFTVTGAVEGNFSGMADFHQVETVNIQTWQIVGHDYNPQTFSINFSKMVVGGPAERPSPGTYSIGNAGVADFTANLTSITDEDFMNAVEYSTIVGDSNNGTLTITSSNENTVKGSFTFTAYRINDNMEIIGTIQCSGEFTAHQSIN